MKISDFIPWPYSWVGMVQGEKRVDSENGWGYRASCSWWQWGGLVWNVKWNIHENPARYLYEGREYQVYGDDGFVCKYRMDQPFDLSTAAYAGKARYSGK